MATAGLQDKNDRRRRVRGRPFRWAVAAVAIVGTSVVSSHPAQAAPPGTLSILAGLIRTSGPPALGPATQSGLAGPTSVAVDASGNTYIADSENGYVEKVSPGGTLSLVVGTLSAICTTPPTAGPAVDSQLCDPDAVAVDSEGDVFIADGSYDQVYEVTPSGSLSIVAASGVGTPTGVAVDSVGNVYVADATNQVIHKITPTGVNTIFAGGGTSGVQPGPAVDSELAGPANLAVDSSNNLYIADTGNNVVEKVTPTGTLSVVAGTGSGTTPATSLNGPAGVAVDAYGNLYVTDGSPDCTIDKITPAQVVSTVAGNAGDGCGTVVPGGPATSSPLYGPVGVAVGPAGNLDIADYVPPSGLDASNVEQVVGVSPPSTPAPGTPSLAGGSIVFPWTPIVGVSSYSVTVYVNGVAQPPVTGLPGPSYTVADPVPGATYAFAVAAVNGAGTSSYSARSPGIVNPISGYWLTGSDGGIFSFGPSFYGSTGGLTLNQPVVGLASSPDGKGYWTVARDGGVFSFGDAAFKGSLPGLVTTTDIVGMAADPATGGYWLVGSNGGVYSFGAPFEGSLPGKTTVSDIVGMAPTATGKGYYLVGADGTVYPFGDAKAQGEASSLAHLNAPIVGITVDPVTGGYWEAGADGGVYAFNAPFAGSAGSLHLTKPIVGISATADGSGYVLGAADGGVFAYGTTFEGSMGGKHLNAPVVGITSAGSPAETAG